MFKILALLLLFTGQAFSAEVPIFNPSQDEDVVGKVNDGGTVKEVMRMDASEGIIKFPVGVTVVNAPPADFNIPAAHTHFQPVLDLTAGIAIDIGAGAYLYNDDIDGGTITGTGTIRNIVQ